MTITVLLALLFLLPFPRLDIGEDSPIFVAGGTSGDAVGGGRGLDGKDVTGRLAFVTPKFL